MGNRQTPMGVRDYLPEEYQSRETVLRRLEDRFIQSSYAPVKLPSFEYYDSIVPALGPGLREKCVAFFGTSGERLVLRPDHTAPIARMVASRYQEAPLPIKLYYLDSIVRRYEKEGEVEFFQAGVEHIGEASPKADAEVVMICIESLLSLDLEGIGIDIGHQRFIEDYSPEEKDWLLRGDYRSLGKIPERGDLSILEDSEDLHELYYLLEAEGLAKYVRFNKGLICPINYYTGMIFEAYVQGYGKVIGSGGRYDGLLEQFGFPCPAVGFALKANQLMRIKDGS